MNHRDYKAFAPGEYYHLYNRGNGKMDIFRDAADYDFLRRRLGEYLYPDPKKTMVPIAERAPRRKSFPPGSFSLVAYCLMPNHFHLLMRQNEEVPISTLMLNLWSGYAKYFNKKYERVGSLFQDQFKAVPVADETYLKWLSAYIHANPVVARLVRRGHEYPYSSYAEYLNGGSGGLCEKGIVLEQFSDHRAYRQFVEESVESIQERKDLEKILID